MAKDFKCDGCEKTFSGSDDNLAEIAASRMQWGDVPAEEMSVLCPKCDREFRIWYAKNFGVKGGKA